MWVVLLTSDTYHLSPFEASSDCPQFTLSFSYSCYRGSKKSPEMTNNAPALGARNCKGHESQAPSAAQAAKTEEIWLGRRTAGA